MQIRRWLQHLRAAGAKKPHSARLFALAVAAAALVVGVFGISASLKVVTVEDSTGASQTILTGRVTTAGILQQAGVETHQADNIFLESYGGRSYIYIERAFPVYVQVDGTLQATYTATSTVAEVLNNVGVTLGEHDYCEPLLNTTINTSGEIQVHRVEYRDTITEEDIPSPIEYKPTPLIRGSKTYTIVQGTPGTNVVTYRERIVDGELESAQVVSTVQTLAPTPTVVLRKGNVWVSDVEGPAVVNNAPTHYTSVMYDVVCTGYYSATGRGASRLGLYAGTVAVNPNVIPYGTKLFITSPDGSFVYGYAIATDTGTALMEGIIGLDLFYESYRESALNGKKLLTVYVI